MRLPVREHSFVRVAEILRLQTTYPLESQVVHLWPIDLSADRDTLEYCNYLLSARERSQAQRFVFDHDRCAYAAAHAALRCLLRLHGVDSALEFELGRYGKPMLPHAVPVLHFNLSHAHGRALVGLCRQPLGVDIEKERQVDVLEIAGNFFFHEELERIRTSTEPRHEFFRHWVCKEAVMKGEGIGFGLELDKFKVRFEENDETAEVESYDTTKLQAGWRVRLVALEPGWCGAVALRGVLPQIRVSPAPGFE